MDLSKRLENAFKRFAAYDSEEYLKLNGDHRKFSLLVLHYNYRQSTITLIGTWHLGQDREVERHRRITNAIKSRVLKYFGETPKNRRMLMVEGFTSGRPICSDTLEKSFDRGEPQGVTFLAKQRGAKVVSPEPPMSAQIRELSKRGFGKYQIILHYVVRQLPWEIVYKSVNSQEIGYMERLAEGSGGRRHGPRGAEYVLRRVIPRLNAEMKRIGGKPLFGLAGSLLVPNYSSDELRPLTDPSLQARSRKREAITNEIAYNVSDIRNRKIISEIDKEVRAGKSPLVVYGRSHFARMKPAFDYMYGKPLKVEV
ncbi:MAG: hypothetical protein KGI04_01505 [Candidatus Micrarchaeota archaeon]|nr:hypothetical protein [Candidatus Micrarchaeota archaeon]